MSVHIQSVDMDVWDAMTNRRYEPQDVTQKKPKVEWTDNDKKKVQYDLKAKNKLISSLGVNE